MTTAAPSRRRDAPPDIKRLMERRAMEQQRKSLPLPYDPAALVASVVDYAYHQAGWYARRRRRPDLRDDLAQAAIAQLQSDANAGKYRPEYAPTTWAHQVCRTVMPREFNRIAWPVKVPVVVGRDDGSGRLNPEQAAAWAVVRAGGCQPAEWHVTTEDDRELDENDEIARAVAAVDGLPEPIRSVVRASYGIGTAGPMAARAIGKQLGISHEHARHLRLRGERMLRMMLDDELPSTED